MTKKKKADSKHSKPPSPAAEKKVFRTPSGIDLQAFYVPPEKNNYDTDMGDPGQFPFTRGAYPDMYRGKRWTKRQYAGFASAEESNKRYKYLLKSGTTGLSVAFDLPTQMGYDSDHALAEGEIGRVGVPVCSLRDMESLFTGIPLQDISTSMTINSTAAILLAFYITVAKRQGVEAAKLSGTVQNDILKEYIARGTYIYPPDPSMRIITDLFSYCKEHLPRWNTISISGYHIREAGANAVQELAFTLANGIAYTEAALKNGLNIDDFASRLSFFFNAHNNLFEEVAKFRAARRMWARIMRRRFNARDDKSCKMRFHTQTAGSTLTAQQPQNNIVRVALQALAAILGGTQSLHTNSYDEAMALPTEESVRTALRTQQIIDHETGVADTVDPLAGSYLVEYLTNDIEKKANTYLDKIEQLGGSVEAIKLGFFQDEIAHSAYEHQVSIENKDTVVVGVNKYTIEAEAPPELLCIDPLVSSQQIKRLKSLKAERDSDKVALALRHLEKAARGTENLMPLIINCAESFVTLGEISDCLRSVFGAYNEMSV